MAASGAGRGWVAAIVSATLLAGLLGDGGGASAGAPKPTNVLVVTTDDQRADEMAPLGAVRRHLAAEGVTFRNAFATFPLCCPSRATFLTGQYAHNHGVVGNAPEEGGGYPAFEDSGSLPIALQAAGYRTGLVGKYLNEYFGPEVPDGWDEWAVRTRGQRLFNYRLNVNGDSVRYGSRPRDYQTDVVARRAVHFIRSSAGGAEPFFLWTSFFAPHTENLRGDERWNPRPAPRHRGRYADASLPPSPAFSERNVSDKPSFVRKLPRLGREGQARLRRLRSSRLASLLAVDDAVSRLIAELRSTGELDNTLIVFTSDNGYLLGEHRLERKDRLYEEAARVPLVIRGPGVPSGSVYKGLVGNIDLAPTILDAADADPLREPDGLSLLPLVASPATGADRDLLLETASSAAVRTPRWMYAEHRVDGRIARELYDLAEDPHQLWSLHAAPSYADVRERLAERLGELRGCAGASCR